MLSMGFAFPIYAITGHFALALNSFWPRTKPAVVLAASVTVYQCVPTGHPLPRFGTAGHVLAIFREGWKYWRWIT